MLTYYLLRIAALIVPRLPLVVGYWLAERAADVSFRFQARARRNVIGNTRHVVGEETSQAELWAIAHEVFRTAARNYHDLFRVPRLTIEDVRRLVLVRGEEHLEQALRQGKGAILVSAHVGNVDIAVQVGISRGYRLTVPVEHVRPEKLFQMVTRIRADKGINLVPVDGGALRAISRALANNEVVVIAADRDILRNGARVTFFGEETTLPDAPAVLALRTGAPILAARSLRNGDGTFVVDILPPIDLRGTGNLKDDVRSNTQIVTDVVESLIRDHPEQWIVFEPVWEMQ
ncbi:MAG: hypothetical protein M1358_25885 [Chloroflexi bacterium]|nr:hypothetical protein [Chloroflexota bacterium]